MEEIRVYFDYDLNNYQTFIGTNLPSLVKQAKDFYYQYNCTGGIENIKTGKWYNI